MQRYLYGYYVREMCWGVEYHPHSYNYVSCRLYDRDGILIDRSYTSSDPDGIGGVFRGRLDDMLRFKDGDIVEWYHPEGYVTLAIIVDYWRPSPEHCWRSWQSEYMCLLKELGREPSDSEVEETYAWGELDDGYEVLDGGITQRIVKEHHLTRSIDLAHSLDVFEPRFSISKKDYSRLKDLYNKRKYEIAESGNRYQ